MGNKLKMNSGRCYHSHKPYQITDNLDTYSIVGGACVDDYPDVDLFIGFDHRMTSGIREFPWHPGVDIKYKIRDGTAPESIENFINLLDYTARKLREGKSVHCGCIGGHGRTGLFLAALTTFMNNDKDSITTVRENYCSRAVETTTQVEWLNKHFGIKKVAGSYTTTTSGGDSMTGIFKGMVPSYMEVDRGSQKAFNGWDQPKVVQFNGKVENSPQTKEYFAVDGCSEFEGDK